MSTKRFYLNAGNWGGYITQATKHLAEQMVASTNATEYLLFKKRFKIPKQKRNAIGYELLIKYPKWGTFPYVLHHEKIYNDWLEHHARQLNKDACTMQKGEHAIELNIVLSDEAIISETIDREILLKPIVYESDLRFEQWLEGELCKHDENFGMPVGAIAGSLLDTPLSWSIHFILTGDKAMTSLCKVKNMVNRYFFPGQDKYKPRVWNFAKYFDKGGLRRTEFTLDWDKANFYPRVICASDLKDPKSKKKDIGERLDKIEDRLDMIEAKGIVDNAYRWNIL